MRPWLRLQNTDMGKTPVPPAVGKLRLVLVQLAGRRHIEAATSALVNAAYCDDARLRPAALIALGATAGPKDLPLLIFRAVQPGEGPERAAAYQARSRRQHPHARSRGLRREPDRRHGCGAG